MCSLGCGIKESSEELQIFSSKVQTIILCLWFQIQGRFILSYICIIHWLLKILLNSFNAKISILLKWRVCQYCNIVSIFQRWCHAVIFKACSKRCNTITLTSRCISSSTLILLRCLLSLNKYDDTLTNNDEW